MNDRIRLARQTVVKRVRDHAHYGEALFPTARIEEALDELEAAAREDHVIRHEWSTNALFNEVRARMIGAGIQHQPFLDGIEERFAAIAARAHMLANQLQGLEGDLLEAREAARTLAAPQHEVDLK